MAIWIGDAGANTVTTELATESPIHINLEAFDGPLDLLLHLIQKHEINIFDIPVADVTAKYMEYIDLMRTLNLDVAGDYLLMAATLMHIKSQMLLPKPEMADGDEAEGDPREELVRRLLEYQKYKDAAFQLSARPLLGRDAFTRAPIALDEPDAGPALLAEVGVYALVDAMARVLERLGKDLSLEVRMERITVVARMRELCERLMERPSVTFDELLSDAVTRSDVVVTFLALLELCRLRIVRLFQQATSDVLHIVRAVEQISGEELGLAKGRENGIENVKPMTDDDRQFRELSARKPVA